MSLNIFPEQKWLATLADEPFAVSCIGVNGSRHIIYGASSKVLYEMCYSKRCMKNVASFNKNPKEILPENSNSGNFGMEADKQHSQKIGKSAKGVDNVMVCLIFWRK